MAERTQLLANILQSVFGFVRETASSLIPRAVTDMDTGRVGIFVGSTQMAGTGAPLPFTSRVVSKEDNGQVNTCTSAQVATINTGLPPGFATLFDGPISFNGSAAVADDREIVSGKNFCVLYAIGTDSYRLVGKKGA